MADERESLWKRLTRLFRSGPVVRHKIAAGERLYEPRGTASAYKRELSNLYVNALASYGQYERLCLSLKTKVCVPGKERAISLEDLIVRYPNGEKFIVYAYDNVERRIVPAWAHHPRSSGFKETVKVTFDDGSTLVCTSDHPCMLRDGSYRDAGDLKPGDSMMPFYRRSFGGKREDGKRFLGYESIYTMRSQPKSWKGWEPEHRLIAEWIEKRDVRKNEEHVHHLDHDPKNNDPANLKIVDASLHLAEHGRHAFDMWKDPVVRQKMVAGIRRAWSSDDGSRRKKIAESNRKNKSKTDLAFEDICLSAERNNFSFQKVLLDLDCSSSAVFNRIKWAGFGTGQSWNNFVFERFGVKLDRPVSSSFSSYWTGKTRSEEWKQAARERNRIKRESRLNHKVVSIEPNGIVEVGDLTVDGYENFATDTIIVHNSRYADYSEMEFCMYGESLVFLPEEGYIKIEDLAKTHADKRFQVVAYDHAEQRFVRAWAKKPRKTRTDRALKISFSNEKEIVVTHDHRLMLSDGSYRMAKNLQVGDDMMVPAKSANGLELKEVCGLSDDDRLRFSIILQAAEDLHFDLERVAQRFETVPAEIVMAITKYGFSSWAKFVRAYDQEKKRFRVSSSGLTVSSIEEYDMVDLYDLTVDGYKNFTTDAVVSHNTPEISSALDIYADEVICPDEDGHVLSITSKDDRIHDILEMLFYEVLNIEFNLWSWTRNLCKYGDFCLFVDASEENGILNLLPIPINEIEREEGFDKEDPFAVRYRWLTQGNMILQNWQIVHFRLLGNDSFLPYGQSIIEPARRIWRQLILIEDAMLVYRVVRSPERRVFKIDVGNLPPEEVERFMEEIKTKLKRSQIVDSATGRVDLRYNPLSVDEDYFLPYRGDKGPQIETLAGGQFTGDIDDVVYIQNKLFAALKVPKAWLGYEQDLGSKATLAQEDVRFAKTVSRVQKFVIAELNKIAILHLYMLGFRGDSLINFEISMANPSTIAEQQRLELWRLKLEVAGMAQEGTFDRETIQRMIFRLTDAQIAKIKEGKRFDKLEDKSLEDIASGAGAESPPPAGGPGAGPEEVPGANELPATLGGEPAGETKPESTDHLQLPGDQELSDILNDDLELEVEELIGERNDGSEGVVSGIAVDKGKDMFSTGEDGHELAFGTKKQTASDPGDLRSIRRVVTRPFSEAIKRHVDEKVDLSKADEWLISAIERSLPITESVLVLTDPLRKNRS